MITKEETYQTIKRWLSGCETAEQVDLCVNVAFEFLFVRHKADHDFRLIKAAAEEKRLELGVVVHKETVH